MQKEAKHLARKIESLRRQSLTKKHNKKEYSLSDSYGQDAKIVQYEERLEELCQKISHIQCKKMLEQKELAVAFVTFRTRWGAALAAQSQQHSNPLLWITEMAPEPRDVLWRNLAIPYRHLPLYKIGVFVAASLLTIFFAIPVTAIQGIAKFERLRKWFPPAMAVQMIPGFGPVITGYLPSAILSGFIYIIPFAMLAMAKLAGYVSRSIKDIKASNMVFYFLVGNVFFLSLLSGSLIDQIGESFTHPKDFPSRLASAVSAQIEDVYETIYETCVKALSLLCYNTTPHTHYNVQRVLQDSFPSTFRHYPLKDAMTNDELDEKSGLMETNYQKALDAYCPPCLRPVNFTAEEPNSSQPLIS
ncbi:Early-responsive to dehydration stress protein [Actinidia rufa]|uniref:Early-responsive to dehydration stress protein n=1 Tax=Actinidia rufa TaxID=165716 RepID=A0A7J0F1V0_9ERIC|nr:Early-responsive to dehydration stress protein [Actinidia rufa]